MKEAYDGDNVALIGAELGIKLFPRNSDPIGKLIIIGSGKYTVIGTLEVKGSGFGESGDRLVFLPFTNVRQYFARPNMDFRISVHPNSAQLMDAANWRG